MIKHYSHMYFPLKTIPIITKNHFLDLLNN